MAVRRTALLLAFAIAGALAGCSGGRAPSAAPEPPTPSAVTPVAATPAPASQDPAAVLAQAARPIAGSDADYADIMAEVGESDRILLGESTHGTHEYFRERARVSEQLVRQHGIVAIAIEGDWTPTYRVNRYVRGLGSDTNAEQALSAYRNFPQWMWPNTDFRDFIERLRAWNMTRPAAERVGVYGMDVYDMFDAADAVIAWLREFDRAAAARAEAQYRCLSPFRRSTSVYGESTLGGHSSCRDEVVAVNEMVRRIPRPRDPVAAEHHFAGRRAAASVVAAEDYFRTAYNGTLAWNVRDQHMAQNVEEIAEHLTALGGKPAKVAIWSHNTHAGDARATFAENRGELNLGQLMRQRHSDDAFSIGFFSYEGTVFAAPEWDAPGRIYTMAPAEERSYSGLFHRTGLPSFSLLVRGNPALQRLLAGPMPERAIGVVYSPATERLSHYFDARLAEQFDAVVYFDRTSAVTPLVLR